MKVSEKLYWWRFHYNYGVYFGDNNNLSGTK